MPNLTDPETNDVRHCERCEYYPAVTEHHYTLLDSDGKAVDAWDDVCEHCADAACFLPDTEPGGSR